MRNEEKLPRLRNGRAGDGSYTWSLSLNKLRTRFLLLKFKKTGERFLAFVIRASADGFAVGASFVFFSLSLTFKDEDYPSEPTMTYGFLISKNLVLYLPNRYTLCRF
jgi:hypothetical protein